MEIIIDGVRYIPDPMHAELGRIAYEAAAGVSGCEQNWEDANQEKWIAAAMAVIHHESTGAGMVLRMVRDAAHKENERLRKAAAKYIEQADRVGSIGWKPYDEFRASMVPND